MLSVMIRIGELAERTGLTVDTVRFYEKQGLIRSAGRSEGGCREFSDDTAETLRFIAKCRALDISLSEIKKLLHVRSRSAKSCREANVVIDDQLARLRDRIRELKKLELQLAELRSVCNQELDPSDCEIIKSLNR